MYLVVLTLLVIKVLEKKKNDVSVRSYLSLLRTFCYSSRFNASGSDKYMYSYNPCQTFRLGPPSNNSCYFRDVALSCFDYFLMMCRGVAKTFQRRGGGVTEAAPQITI